MNCVYNGLAVQIRPARLNYRNDKYPWEKLREVFAFDRFPAMPPLLNATLKQSTKTE